MLPSGSISWRRQFDQHRGRIGLVYKYVTGQGLLQLLNVLNGFFLLRWLSIDEQAKFSLAMGLQATLGILGDLGLGGSLLGLIGNRVDDRKLIGQYVAGIRQFKNRLFVVSAIVGTIAVSIFYRKQNWGFDVWLIYVFVLLGIYAQSMIGYYSAILQMKKDLLSYYRAQITSASIRLIAAFLLYYSLGLTAAQTVLIATIAFIANAIWVRRYALFYFESASKANADISREIVKTLWPIMPMVAFYAIQGQVTLFMSGYFGKSANVAEIGALGRLNQLYSLLIPFNSIVLLPFFAKSSKDKILIRYTSILFLGILITAPIIAIGYCYPFIFMWMLGGKYISIGPYVGPYILAASIWYISSIIWSINAAQKWNYWLTSLFYVLVVCTIQALCIYLFDLSRTFDIIRLNIYMAIGTLFSYLLVSARGYIIEKKYMLKNINMPF